MVLKKKKNWESVNLNKSPFGYIIMLDGTPIKTPLRNDLVIENRLIAQKVHEEWLNVEREINFTHMPYTKVCFISLDRSEEESFNLRNKLLDFGMSDLLCYRAEIGSDLAKLQSKGWDPLLEWIQIQLKITFKISHSIMPVEQSSELKTSLSKLMLPIPPISLTAMDDLVTLSGSLIIGLAILNGKLSPERGWKIIRIDEDWQRDIWGVLDEQKAEDKIKKSLFIQACKILQMVQK